MEEKLDKAAKDAARTDVPGGWQCSACGQPVADSAVACPRDGTRNLSALEQDPQFRGYKFIGAIGAGGMGVIYKARHVSLNKIVAVKMLHPYLVSTDAVRRFKTEGQAANRLDHPFIIKVHDLGVCGLGPFMIMDYVDGRDLTRLMRDEPHLSLERVVSIFIQASDALSHAHSRGVLHRDIKPSNIMLRRNYRGEEEVCIMDFGIAKLIDDAVAGGKLTRTGEAIGSPSYMSPEQARGSTAIDARSDLYSLGCVMFESLTGAPPFEGNTPLETLLMHIQDKPVSLSQAVLGSRRFDPRIEMVIERLLEKDPERRYQSMDELKLHLSAINDGKKLEQLVYVPPEAKKQPPAAFAIAGAIFVAALAALLFSVGQLGKSGGKTAATFPKVAGTQATLASKPIAVGAQGAGAGDSQSNTDVPASNISVRQLLLKSITAGDRAIHLPSQLMPVTDQDVVDLKLAHNAEGIFLSYSHVSAAGLENLTGLPNLKELDLSWCPNINDLAPLRRIAGLKILNLSHDVIGDQQLRAIAGMHLERLYLSDTKVENLDSLRGMQSLRVLEVARTSISDKAVQNIGMLSNLQDLDLNGTSISDSALGYLTKLHNLGHLSLIDCNKLTDAAIDRLRKGLPDDCEVKSFRAKAQTTTLPTEQAAHADQEMFGQALVLFANGHTDKADALLRRLLDRLHKQKSPPGLLLERADAQSAKMKWLLHQPDAALKLISDAIEIIEAGSAKDDAGQLPGGYYLKAQICFELKRNDEAFAALSKCAQLYKDSDQSLYSTQEWRDREIKRADALRLMGVMHINVLPRNPQSAERELKEAMDIFALYAPEQTGALGLELGRSYRYDADDTKDAAERGGKLLEARDHLASIDHISHSGMTAVAVSGYTTLLAETEFQLGHSETAKSILKPLLQQERDKVLRHNELSLMIQICQKTGRHEEAQAYEKEFERSKI